MGGGAFFRDGCDNGKADRKTKKTRQFAVIADVHQSGLNDDVVNPSIREWCE